VERVRTSPCTGGTEEVLPVQFDHVDWAFYAQVAVQMANVVTQHLIAHNNTLDGVPEEFFFEMAINNVNDVDSAIFGCGLATEEYVYTKYRQFCPYAYRKDKVYAHDISLNYDYFTNSTEWFHVLRYKDWNEAGFSLTEIKYR